MSQYICLVECVNALNAKFYEETRTWNQYLEEL